MTVLGALLLAAGESTRMKEMKALLPWQWGFPIITSQIYSLHGAGYSPIIVVLGHQAKLLREYIPSVENVLVVENTLYRQGRTTSILRGLEELSSDIAGVLIGSVDQPRTTRMLRTLKESFEKELPEIALPAYEGRSGHPPIFASSLLSEIRAITEEGEGLRSVISAHRENCTYINVDDPLALTNLNTREDYDAALKLLSE